MSRDWIVQWKNQTYGPFTKEEAIGAVQRLGGGVLILCNKLPNVKQGDIVEVVNFVRGVVRGIDYHSLGVIVNLKGLMGVVSQVSAQSVWVNIGGMMNQVHVEDIEVVHAK